MKMRVWLQQLFTPALSFQVKRTIADLLMLSTSDWKLYCIYGWQSV